MTKYRKTILVLGARGLVGSAVMRSDLTDNYLLHGPSSMDLDLMDFHRTVHEIKIIAPDVIINAAARVGGIGANSTFGGEFIYRNLRMEINIIEAARMCSVPKLIFLGSSCIYPRDCPQPIKEEHLLTGPLEPTNKPYAVAKIAGIEMCDAYRKQYGCDFVSLMPTNLYGSGDSYDLENSHVLPAMIRKFHEAKLADARSVTMWGSGMPMREFLHVDDLASAIAYVIRNNLSWEGPMNVGTGLDVSIGDLARTVAHIIGYTGDIIWDVARPDGTPRKQLDVNKIRATGWSHSIHLEDGLTALYGDLKNKPVKEWSIRK